VNNFIGEDSLDFGIPGYLGTNLREVLIPLFKLNLNSRLSSDFDMINNIFGDLLREDAKFIPNIIYKRNMRTWIQPDKVFSQNKEHLEFIASFLKYIAMKYGTIRIYGYNIHSNGLHHLKTEGSLDYYSNPQTDPELIDSGFGGSAPNRRYFELSYNPETNDFENFDLNDYKKFLGALLVDKQTFIIRPEWMWDTPEHLDQYRNKILFAFNFWTPKLKAQDIIGCRSIYVGPTTENKLLLEVDDEAYDVLSALWEYFILNTNLYLLPHISEDQFIDNLDSISFLNSRTSSIGQFGNPNRFEILGKYY